MHSKNLAFLTGSLANQKNNNELLNKDRQFCDSKFSLP